MRLTAPELAARYRDGMVAEGATVVDAGQVGSEMLYYLVGSRELDGGLMCTASHNPKAYTGAKLVKRGRDRAVGRRRHPGRAQHDRGRAGPSAPGGGSVEQVDVYEEFQAAALKFIDPAPSSRCASSSTAATGWPGRWSARCSSSSASTS